MTPLANPDVLEDALAGSSLTQVLSALRGLGPRHGFERFAAAIDPEWIEQALAATGTTSVRRRRFPAEQVVWAVLGACLFADRSITHVVGQLGFVLPGERPLAPSAVTKARYKLGEQPLRWLFRRVADAWSEAAGIGAYKGLGVFGIDGTHLRVADSDANLEHFGKPGGRGGSGDAGYPQARVVALLNLSNRLLVGAEIGKWSQGELTVAQPLLDDIPSNSVTILDRGLISYLFINEIVRGGENRHALVRARKDMKVTILSVLEDGSALAQWRPTPALRRQLPGLAPEILIRVIEYRHPDSKSTSRLFVTLTDAKKHPARELIALYHERWELEIAFDEIKTHMLERKECLRSQKPEGVMQEIWGQLLVYNLVRREMLRIAAAKGLPANRISFRTSLLWIRDFWVSAALMQSPGNLPRDLAHLEANLAALVLPERRSERRFPRHVKIKMSNYPRNRGRRLVGQPPGIIGKEA